MPNPMSELDRLMAAEKAGQGSPSDQPKSALDIMMEDEARRERERSQMQSVGRGAVVTTPQDAASRVSIAEKTGVPSSLLVDPKVRRDYEEMAKIVDFPVDRLIGTRTGSWAASNPDNAAIAQTSFDPMLAIEGKHKAIEDHKRAVEEANAKSGYGMWRGLANRFAQGTNQLLRLPGTMMEMAVAATGDKKDLQAFQLWREAGMPGLGMTGQGQIAAQLDKLGSRNLQWLQSGPQRATEELVIKDPKTGEELFNWGAVNLENALGIAAQEAPAFMAQMALAAETGGISALPALAKLGRVGKILSPLIKYSTSAAGLMETARTATSVYDQGKQQLMQQGMTEEEAGNAAAPGAFLAGLFSAGFGSPMEAKFMEDMVEKIAKVPHASTFAQQLWARTRSMLTMGAKEGVQEAAQGIGEDLAQWLTFQPDMTLKQAAGNAVMNFFGGAIMGGPTAFAMHGSQSINSAQQKDLFDAINKGAESEAYKLAPAKWKEFIDHITKDGPVQDVSMPVSRWNTFWQSQGVDPAAKAAELGISPKAYAEAVQTNTDITMKTAEFGTHIAGTEHYDELIQDVRFQPGMPTMREEVEQKAEMQGKVEEILKEFAASPENPATTAAATIEQQLVAAKVANGMNEKTAKTEASAEAKLYEKFIATMSAREGMTPEELVQRYPLKVIDGQAKVDFTPKPTREQQAVNDVFNQSERSGVSAHTLDVAREGRTVADRSMMSAAEKTVVKNAAKQHGLKSSEVEAQVRETKMRFPTSDGWAPMEVSSVKKGEDGKVELTWKVTPYSFDRAKDGTLLKEGSPEYKKRIKALGKGILDEVFQVFQRAEAGDKNAKNILAQAGWYKEMRSRLRHEFGGLGDLFADLLGATSPNTPVRENFKYAADVLRRATRGDFDELVPKWAERYDKIDKAEAELSAWLNAEVAAGRTKKSAKADPIFTAKLAEIAELRKMPDSMLPVKEAGPKYGFNGKNITRALVDLWRTVKEPNADIGRGGTAPKALNFSGNLIGFRERATIDVWAARFLNRIAGFDRVPVQAESGVGGMMLPSGETQGQFRAGQDAFQEAVKLIRADERMKGDKTLGKINDDDLQAVVWFVEKELWTQKNWTSAAGEGGSFELEANLAGSDNPAEITRLRKILDSSKSTPEQKAQAQKELDAMHRTVDRFTGGLSAQKSEGTQGIDYVPTDEHQAVIQQRLKMAIYEADPEARVMGSKVVSTLGRYMGEGERAIDLEVVAREGYDPSNMHLEMLRQAQENDQQSMFMSRVVRAEEEVDPTRHRPGIEIYFRNKGSVEQLKATLDKLHGDLPFYTVIMDGRPTAAARAGADPEVVGVRFQYMPEFMDGDGLNGAPPQQVSAKMQEQANALLELADKVLAENPDVTSAQQLWYETDVTFAHQYQEKIDAITSRDAGKAGPGARGQAWAGRSHVESLADAARFTESAAGQPAPQSGDAQRGDAAQSLYQSVGPDGGSGSGGGSLPVFDGGINRQGPNPIEVHAVHYSGRENLTELNGAFWNKGGGNAGRERERLAGLKPDDPLLKRTFFYVSQDGTLPKKEAVVWGNVPYEVKLTNLMDLRPANRGSEEFQKLLADTREWAHKHGGADGYTGTALERMVLALGYSGFVTSTDGIPGETVTLLGNDAVPVRRVTPTATQPGDSIVNLDSPTGGVTAVTQPTKAVDVNSPEFKAWFGNSAVREQPVTSRQKLSDMKPVVVYHGTNQPVEAFQTGRKTVNTWTFGESETTRHGIFFAENRDFAGTFAESRGETGANVIPVYLKIENPFYMDQQGLSDFYAKSAEGLDKARAGGDEAEIKKAQGEFNRARWLYNLQDTWEVFDGEEGKAFVSWLKANGYDGAFIQEDGHGLGDNAPTQNVWVALDPAQIKSAISNTGNFSPTGINILYQAAYHGSPFRFDKFSLEHLGNGEGAQAYGWGLYFAGDKKVAEYYRETLGANQFSYDGAPLADGTPRATAAELLHAAQGDKQMAKEDADSLGLMASTKRSIKREIDALDYGKIVKGGQLYKVDIPGDETMLLWDKRVDEQPEAVRKALDELQVGTSSPSEAGSSVYDRMKYIFGSDEAASKALGEHGVNGIKYLDASSRASGEGSYNYVVFDDSAVKILDTYYQQGGGVRGALHLGPDHQMSLQLFQSANASSGIHELGHYFLEVMADLASRDGASQQTKDDYAAVLKAYGKDGQHEISTVGGKPVNLTHERFADAFIKYIHSQEAPSAELKPVFHRFTKWLTKIWNVVQSGMVQTEVSPEMKDVFDRLLAADHEIEAVKNDLGKPMFATAEAAGMTEVEFQAYLKTTDLGAAKEKLVQRLMHELDRQQSKERKEALKAAMERVQAEVLAMPEYQALMALADGKMADGTEVKLSKQALLDAGIDPKTLAKDGIRTVYTSDGGMDPDTAATLMGFESGDQLIKALTGLESRKAFITRLAEGEVEHDFPNTLKNPAELRKAAIEALAESPNAERTLAIELRAIQAKEREFRPVAKAKDQEARQKAQDARGAARAAAELPNMPAYQEAARRMVQDMQATKLSPFKYLQAQRKASSDVMRAWGKQDYSAASEAKRTEIMNHYLYIESMKARDQIERRMVQQKKLDSPKVQEKIGKAGGTFLEQIIALRARFGFSDQQLENMGTRTETLAQWVANNEFAEIDDRLTDESWSKPYGEMTVEELNMVFDALSNIKTLAYKESQFISQGKSMAFEQAGLDIVASIDKFNKRTPVPLSGTKLTRKQEIIHKLKGFDATMIKMEALINWIDDGKVDGPAHRHLWNPIAEAQTMRYDMTVAIAKPLQEAFNRMPKKMRENLDETFMVDGFDQPLSRRQVISMLLNAGNEVNYNKLLKGYNWTNAQVQEAFGHLTVEETQFVQGLWDTIERMWPEMVALEKRFTGVEPKKQEIRPITIYNENGGVTAELRGGYWPLKYDPQGDTDVAAKQNNAERMLNGSPARPGTSRSAVKERTQFTGQLLLNFEYILTAHINDVIMDLSHREALHVVDKLTRRPEVKKAIQEAFGPEYYQQIVPWLKTIAGDNSSAAAMGISVWTSWAMKLRSNSVAAVLGFKFTSTIVQFADIARVIGPGDYRVSVPRFTAAFLQFMGSPKETTAMVRELSGEMRHRSENLDRDIRETLNRMTGQQSLKDRWNRAAFKGLALMDSLVSVPAWLGAYQQAMAEHGDSDKAVLEADRVVRMKLMSGNPKDLAGVQRDNEMMKLITMFLGDASANYNMMRNAGHKAKGLRGFVTQFTPAAMLVMAGALIGDFLKGQWPEESDNPEEWAKWVMHRSALAPFQTIPGLRDAVNALDAKLSGKPFADYRFTPAFSAVQKVIDGIDITADMLGSEKEVDAVTWAIKSADAIGYAFGIGGTAQATGAAKYLHRVDKGEEKPDNTFEMIYNATQTKPKAGTQKPR